MTRVIGSVPLLGLRPAGGLACLEVREAHGVTRAEPVSAQAEAGNVILIEGAWNDAFLDEVSNFPNGTFKDQVDAMSRAFMELQKPAYGMLAVV